MKKIISLILIVLMLVPLTVSCNNTSNDVVDTDSDTTQTTTEAVENAGGAVDLSEFFIVYSGSYGINVSNALKTAVFENTGVKLTLKKAGENVVETEHEFLIGNTGRTISEEYYKNIKSNADKYGYIIENGKVFLYGIDAKTIEKSCNLFTENYVKKGSTEIFLEDETSNIVTMDLRKEEKLPERAPDDQLRLVSHNIICMYLKYGADPTRLVQMQSLYALLDPDVLGFQECDQPWFDEYGLDKILGEIGYKLAPVSNTEHTNRIMYNDETLELIESGSSNLQDNYGSERSFAWALLKDKKTDKKFIAASVHYSAHLGDGARREQAISLRDQLQALEQKYGVPVMCCGDYNSSPSEYGNVNVMQKVYNSARYICEKKVNMSYSTVNKDGAVGGVAVIGTAIDHVFYSKTGIKGKLFETLISEYAYIISDHLPILFDFTLT